ncbi:UNVERIFIED_CONTAM: hypothetical protein Sradi_3610100 [Sesamum radiatum]|uniref:Uncharacterized protein n=1 Tax=Sesamum radiatum TaxID=300843 RepID=A0AAW2QHG4_SESRA
MEGLLLLDHLGDPCFKWVKRKKASLSFARWSLQEDDDKLAGYPSTGSSMPSSIPAPPLSFKEARGLLLSLPEHL